PVSLPPCGWSVMELAWEEGVARPSRAAAATAAVRLGEHAIGNGIFRVEANPGAPGIDIRRDGSPVFAGAGLGVVTVDDAWGSWGGMADEPASLDLSSVRHHWSIAASEVLEDGPERALLAVRLTGGHSRLDLHLSLAHSRPVVDVAARLFLDE